MASLAAYVWNLHQHLPARDRGAEERFLRAQDLLLAANGDSVHSSFVQIAEPSLRVQVLEGDKENPYCGFMEATALPRSGNLF